jgi:RNA polymerase sigma-70 factor (ECF subfamily)
MHRSRQARFGLLIEGYAADLYRYAAWLCGDRATAEDLVQETFMRAWRSLDTLRKGGAAKPWLFSILRRDQCRQPACRCSQAAELEADSMAAVSRCGTSAETFALRRALAALAPEYREPLVLQIIGGFSCEEIAQLLGINTSAVMTRVFRARRQLRDVLSDDRLDVSSRVLA